MLLLPLMLMHCHESVRWHWLMARHVEGPVQHSRYTLMTLVTNIGI
jgi:hypothetical protein